MSGFMWAAIALAPSLHPYFLYSLSLEDARRYLKSGVQRPYTHTRPCVHVQLKYGKKHFIFPEKAFVNH